MMAKSMWLPLATLACFMTSQADAQKLFLGGCPAQEVVQNFDTTRYLGKWYEIEKYFAIFEIGGRCITSTYSDKGSGKIGVVNEQIGVIGDKPNSIEAEAQFVDPDSGEAKLFVSFGIDFLSNLQDRLGFPRGNGNYWVLDTDYDNYALVWSCQDLRIVNAQNLWILTRKQKPDPEVLKEAKDIIEKRGLDTSRLEVTDQTNCS